VSRLTINFNLIYYAPAPNSLIIMSVYLLIAVIVSQG